MRSAVIAAMIAVASPCAASPAQPGAGSPLPRVGAAFDGRFVFHYPPADAPSIPVMASFLEEHSPRVRSDLDVAEMAPVHVWIYETHSAMADAVRPIVAPTPSTVSGLVTAADRIHLLSPRRTGDPAERAAVSLLQEFAHCVTLRLNASSANNPVAVYQARWRTFGQSRYGL